MTYTNPIQTPEGPLSRLRRMVFPGGFLYEDAHYLASEVDLDPRAARRFLPWPLSFGEDPTATVFTGFFPKNTFGSVYHEAGVFFHVRHGRTPVIFCPWMLVDDDVALIVGRELLGYPKKLGEIDWSLSGDGIHGVASRRGSTLITMRGTLGPPVVDAPKILGKPHRNVRASMGLAMPKLVAFTPSETPIEVREASLTLEIGASERDPLCEMGLGKVRRSLLHRVNLRGGGIPVPVHAVSPYWYLTQLLLRGH